MAEFEQQLANPDTYSRSKKNAPGRGDISALTHARELAEQRVAKLTDRWEELEAKKAAPV